LSKTSYVVYLKGMRALRSSDADRFEVLGESIDEERPGD
jgi:hypothetical protein